MLERARPLHVPLLAALSCGLAAACSARTSHATDTLVVLAAASTAPAIEDVAQAFEDRHGVRALVSSAASSTLARQLEAGAEADVFVSADARWIEYLANAGLLEPDSPLPIAAGRLALVVPGSAGATGSLNELGGTWPELGPRIAVGDPAHVPLGRYTRDALRRLGRWDELEARLVPTLDARAALRLVERAEVDAGLVYESDAVRSSGVTVLGLVPESAHDPIRCFAARVRGSGERAAAFLELLSSDAGRSVFREHGFRPVRP